MNRSAIMSNCGKYRYHLSRAWGKGHRACAFVMLNPSTADADIDDPTIRRCVEFSKRWGFDKLEVFNIFALRATDPRELLKCPDPVGPENNDWIREAGTPGLYEKVVCAWGTHGHLRGRSVEVLKLLAPARPSAFGLNKDGSPKHPLYLPYSAVPTEMVMANYRFAIAKPGMVARFQKEYEGTF